ncbi:unnamed protein product [Rhodiola kirilowii]
MLDKQGYTFKAENEVMKVTKGSLVIMKGIVMNVIYVLLGNTIVGAQINYAEKKVNDMSLWHLRLAHVGEKGLEKLYEQGCLGAEKPEKLLFCENCILGKATKVKFNKAIHRTSDVLDYVHSDLWGPTKTESHSGKKYFMTFIDDFSRRVWIYFLARKSDAFETFKTWKTLVENQTGKHIKRLRTDNGLEYLDSEFINFCKLAGIAKHHTVASNPQQNGLAERYNRTILERVRCLLLQAGMSKNFWAEAANTACYLINRCPSAAIEFKTPMQMWSNHPVDYIMLKVFGCAAYAHVRQDKLEPRALKCVFLGYPYGVKGYKLWCLEKNHKKTFISRDVVFNEFEFPLKVSQNVSATGKGNSLEIIGADKGKSALIEVEQGNVAEPELSRTDLPEPQQQEDDHENPADVPIVPKDYVLTRDRTRRPYRKPARYGYETGENNVVAYAFSVAADVPENEPRTVREALELKEADEWFKAMEEEMRSLKKNDTWKLVDRPDGVKLVGCKWVFKFKEGIPGVEKPRYKARLVAKGFTQREGVDFNEIYSPVVKHRSIRIVLSIVAHCNLELEQLDVKTAFLYGSLDETFNMSQPECFISRNAENSVCLLNKSLYGLKQSPR